MTMAGTVRYGSPEYLHPETFPVWTGAWLNFPSLDRGVAKLPQFGQGRGYGRVSEEK